MTDQTIVDIAGLAKVLCTSQSTLLKNWRKYPHFFISEGRTARGARFDSVDVLNHLKARDYDKVRSEDKELGSGFQDIRIREKTKAGIPNRRGSAKWEDERRLRLLYPEQAQTLLRLSIAGSEYLQHCKRQKMAHNTLRDKASTITQFIFSASPDILIKDVKTFHVSKFLDQLYDDRQAEYLNSKKKKPIDPGKNANRKRRELVTFFNHFVKKQIINSNPATAIDDYDEMEFKKHVPTGEDIDLVKAVCDQNELDIIRTLIHTGARAGELRGMQFKDFDPSKKILRIWTTKRKGSKRDLDIIEAGPSLTEILTRRLRNRKDNCEWIFPGPSGMQMNKEWIDNLLPRLCKRVEDKLKALPEKPKFKPFTAHSIRHYMAAQIFLREGLASSQKFLRHKRATTTDIYIRSILDLNTISAPSTDDIESSMSIKDNTGKVVQLFK